MPRYFFHVYDGTEMPDGDGVEFSDANEARAAAVVATGEALRDAGRRFWRTSEWQMLVTDEAGATVCQLKVVADG